MSKILDFLVEIEFLTLEKKTQILEELKAPVPVLASFKNGEQGEGKWRFDRREQLFAKNRLNKHIFEVMMAKETNLCVAADLTKTKEILELIDKIHPYICALKLHIDVIDDFSEGFLLKLKSLAKEHIFVLFEDRKFADTGKTMGFQLKQGLYKISSWANMVTLHSVAGEATISTFCDTMKALPNSSIEGGLLIAELSTAGALTRDFYTKETVDIAKKNSEIIGGFICQKRCHDDPGFLFWTPGVNQEKTTDGAGQQWRSIEDAIMRDKNDIIIVGRAITSSENMATTAKKYASAGWEALKSRES